MIQQLLKMGNDEDTFLRDCSLEQLEFTKERLFSPVDNYGRGLLEFCSYVTFILRMEGWEGVDFWVINQQK